MQYTRPRAHGSQNHTAQRNTCHVYTVLSNRTLHRPVEKSLSKTRACVCWSLPQCTHYRDGPDAGRETYVYVHKADGMNHSSECPAFRLLSSCPGKVMYLPLRSRQGPVELCLCTCRKTLSRRKSSTMAIGMADSVTSDLC